MSTTDKHITDILSRYGEDFSSSVWRVQGNAVIYHKALERIAAQAKVSFDPPMVLRAERDEAVLLVQGHMGGRAEWSIGEALINTNYRVSGRQAAYVYAMAEKRAKDRVILKLIGLHGVYSEDEADDFRRPPVSVPEPPEQSAAPPAGAVNGAVVDFPGQPSIDESIASSVRRDVDRAGTINAVTDVMLSPKTQARLNDLSQPARDELRAYAKARLVALGWPSKKGA